MLNLEQLTQDTRQALQGLLAAANLSPRQVLVVGCSTSEVAGKKIGSSGSLEVAEAILQGILPPLQEAEIYLAVQCCEHLNRALVVEKEAALKYGWEEVTVVPHEKAGGSLATLAYDKFKEPVVVEEIQAHAGMDIGDTFIGMHLKKVAVPVRLDIKKIGQAHLTLARTRPKLIGGERAKYCR
ncbi:MAG: TIGR01440 family protein [Clostridia bacterium]|nr:TIGR01440 family protein [Clostridia bacterium]